MSCNEWNEQWVARLYGELDAGEERRLDQHVAGCAACARKLEELERARVLLREGTPAIPPAPRAVVLRSSTWRHPAWGFAAGLAAALVVFAAGVFAGVTTLGRPVAEVGETRAAEDASQRAALEQRVVSLEAELVRLASAREARPTTLPASAESCASPADLAAGLAKLEERVRYDRQIDVEYLLGEMQSVERRAAGWVDETREAVRLVALSSDPRLNER
jgi:anti-sigma factor RsiW